jgi:hypothetical protein
VPPLLPSPAQLVYLWFHDGFPLPSSSALRAPCPLATCLCCSCLFIFSFFPGWGSVCPGGYANLAQGCLWEYHMLLSSPCPHFPNHLGAGVWQRCGSPPGFSI